MKLNELTLKERFEGTFLVVSMLFLLYFETADFRLVLFIIVCFVYFHDEKVKSRKQFEQLKAELAVLKDK